MEKTFYANGNQVRAGLSILIPGKIDFNSNTVTRDKEVSIYSWPFISKSFASADSANYRAKTFGRKNSRKFQKAKLKFAAHWQLFT